MACVVFATEHQLVRPALKGCMGRVSARMLVHFLYPLLTAGSLGLKVRDER